MEFRVLINISLPLIEKVNVRLETRKRKNRVLIKVTDTIMYVIKINVFSHNTNLQRKKAKLRPFSLERLGKIKFANFRRLIVLLF